MYHLIKTGLLFLLSFFAINAAAESYICIATKSVALLERDNGSISMSEVDVSNLKYLLSEEEGNLKFKQFGSKDYIPCSTPYFCTCGHVAWCGQFFIK